MKGDSDYMACLLHMCQGNRSLCAADGPLDYEVLWSHVLENLMSDHLSEYVELHDAWVVFRERCLHDFYNELRAMQFTQCTGRQLRQYLAVNKIKKKSLHGEQRLQVSCMCCKDSKKALGWILLVIGMPVMVTENLSLHNKVINGSEGVMDKIIYRPSDEGCEAVCVHIHIPSSPITIDSLTPHIVPIFPRTVCFDHKLHQGGKIRIS